MVGTSFSASVYIVVLNWNNFTVTAECLRSLEGMVGASFKILVVDNGSSDESVQFLREAFPRIEIIANKVNLGFAGGCNVGMRRASEDGAEYILLVNNDTVVDPFLLQELLKEAHAHPQVGILSPKIYYFDPSNAIWWAGGRFNMWTGLATHIDLRKTDVERNDQPRDLDWATGCVMLLRTEALRETGLFDEQLFNTGEDVDLSLRMRAVGFPIRYVPTARLWHKESVDIRKNVGQHVRAFMAARNLLWVMHKHARIYHWISFWPVFGCYYLPKMILISLRTHDRRSCISILQGVLAFWRMLLMPGTSVLPEELKATTGPNNFSKQVAFK
jgi:GT2 family glycosyltransferase